MDVLALIWFVMVVKGIVKVSVENRVNNLLIWIHVNISGFQGFKDNFYWLVEGVF